MNRGAFQSHLLISSTEGISYPITYPGNIISNSMLLNTRCTTLPIYDLCFFILFYLPYKIMTFSKTNSISDVFGQIILFYIQIMYITNQICLYLVEQVLVVVQPLSCVRLLQPHGLQPATLLCPWDSPGKNTGVG